MTSEHKNKKKVLFLCSHNSARSQMAEGLLRAIYGERYEVHSAGVQATYVDPHAVRAMSEIGVDISGQHSKSVADLRGVLFDVAVTVCDNAWEMCPLCPADLKGPATTPAAKEVIHRAFKDPAAIKGSDEERMDAFRQARDEIREWIIQMFE